MRFAPVAAPATGIAGSEVAGAADLCVVGGVAAVVGGLAAATTIVPVMNGWMLQW